MFNNNYYYDIMLYMNKVLIVLGFIIIAGIYFYAQRDIKEPMTDKKSEFIASSKFAGAKNGYVFKMDTQGLGYYLDTAI